MLDCEANLAVLHCHFLGPLTGRRTLTKSGTYTFRIIKKTKMRPITQTHHVSWYQNFSLFTHNAEFFSESDLTSEQEHKWANHWFSYYLWHQKEIPKYGHDATPITYSWMRWSYNTPECATSIVTELVLCSFAVGFDYQEKLLKPTLSETYFFLWPTNLTSQTNYLNHLPIWIPLKIHY